MTPVNQERLLINIKKKALHFSKREIKCYSTFHLCLIHDDRKIAIANISKEIIFYEPKSVNRKTSWINQSKYAFVLSPRGRGLDCHRTWEALCLGCIPIVKKSPITKLFR